GLESGPFFAFCSCVQKGELVSEKHPLCWIDAGEDFFDLERFAGEGNIGHMVEQVRDYGMGVPEK
ncbi:MAG: DNA mismatch repair protein MutT, partial [Clostridia bacterium]